MWVAKELWKKHHGNVDLRPYDRELGAYYIAKTANRDDFDYCDFNLERVKPKRSIDLFEAQRIDPYVPDHVRHMTFGQTLALRDPFL